MYSDEHLLQLVVSANTEEVSAEDEYEENCREIAVLQDRINTIIVLKWISVAQRGDESKFLKSFAGLQAVICPE